MRPLKLFSLICALPLLASCWYFPAAKTVRMEKPRPVQSRAKLSEGDQKKIEQLYYQAVDAYSKDDAAGSDAYLNEIFKLDPSYAPAKELREKLKLTGKKPGIPEILPVSTPPAGQQDRR